MVKEAGNGGAPTGRRQHPRRRYYRPPPMTNGKNRWSDTEEFVIGTPEGRLPGNAEPQLGESVRSLAKLGLGVPGATG
jgi:hypothetical protein